MVLPIKDEDNQKLLREVREVTACRRAGDSRLSIDNFLNVKKVVVVCLFFSRETTRVPLEKQEGAPGLVFRKEAR